ncbi:pyrroloquinoline quinone biosynthesis peptide chaperone PqqD [Dechloromonas sp. A34]|uniref:pyrroloquinoline quinone biosynthesis peptide chaperone PqqD n=1 Tax=Dechloromonas sp. A34 TaxID=447588 RepID=UPI0022488988|nr:pyrroloquinoline quinone biosynthesis peptide chaperone PqqD [Dechloromonas sp. A34]
MNRPQLNPHYVFRWEASQDAHILLYPEGLIKLNPAAAEILKRCDGQRSADDIVADLDAAFPGQREAIARDAEAFLDMARDKGWLSPA